MAPARIPVGVIEDHPLYRTAVARLLTESPDIELDAVADSVERFAACRRCPNSVVLLDLTLPGLRDAAAVLAVVRMGHPVLVLSAQSGRSEVLIALAAGARGYLCKSADSTEILHAVRTTAAGTRYVSPALLSAEVGAGRRIVLSEREREVLSRLAVGERDQEIAQTLKISVRTVRTYLDRIRDKTGLRRRPALTRYAIEHGVVAGRMSI